MIELVVGAKGTGKTKILTGKANNDIKISGSNIMYLDMNNKHLDQLSNRVRLLNVPEFKIHSKDMFIGFIYGIVSQAQNLDRVFLDNFITIACVSSMDEIEETIQEIEKISDKFEVDFAIAISKAKEELSEYLKGFVSVSL